MKTFLSPSIAYSKSDVGIGSFLPIAVSLGAMFKAVGAGTMAPAEDLRLGSSSSIVIFLFEFAVTRLFLNNAFLSGYLGNRTGAATLKIMMKIDHERCCTAITTVVLIDDDATLS